MDKMIKIASIMIIILLLPSCSKTQQIWEINEKNFKEKIFEGRDMTTVCLSKYTDFEWDILYTFRPYISIEKIYKIIGYKFSEIQETVSEDMDQIIFLKDKKVVYYLYGYPTNNGYGFSIPISEGDFTKIAYNDNAIFQVERSDSYILLKLQ